MGFEGDLTEDEAMIVVISGEVVLIREDADDAVSVR